MIVSQYNDTSSKTTGLSIRIIKKDIEKSFLKDTKIVQTIFFLKGDKQASSQKTDIKARFRPW